jgi:hypothetical protein
MSDIIFRVFEGATRVCAVDPEYAEDNTEPCTDVVLTFDQAGKFVTAQLVTRNEQTLDDHR